MLTPDFKPFPFLGGGNRQTLLSYYVRGRRPSYQATPHQVDLADGDQIIVHDDCPEGWQSGDPFVLMLHGLGGCHQSDYMVRLMEKLNQRGVRSFRLDHRDCGAAVGKALLPYHSGMTGDLMSTWQVVRKLCPDSPGGVVGYSMSGNIILKAAGTNMWSADDPSAPRCFVALNPPIDLYRCSAVMSTLKNYHYNAHFVNYLFEVVRKRNLALPDAPKPLWTKKPKTMREFDHLYTAPVSGFDSADDYYSKCSANQFVDSIQIPSYVLSSEDDPLIPVQQFRELPEVENLFIHITRSGGHLGFVGCKGIDPDRRWMDWRIIDWMTPHLQQKSAPAKTVVDERVAVGSTLRR